MRRFMFPVMMAALLAVILLGPAPAEAQSLNLFQKKPAADATAGPPAPGDVQDLIRLLSDPRVVEWLKQNATAAATQKWRNNTSPPADVRRPVAR